MSEFKPSEDKTPWDKIQGQFDAGKIEDAKKKFQNLAESVVPLIIEETQMHIIQDGLFESAQQCAAQSIAHAQKDTDDSWGENVEEKLGNMVIYLANLFVIACNKIEFSKEKQNDASKSHVERLCGVPKNPQIVMSDLSQEHMNGATDYFINAAYHKVIDKKQTKEQAAAELAACVIEECARIGPASIAYLALFATELALKTARPSAERVAEVTKRIEKSAKGPENGEKKES